MCVPGKVSVAPSCRGVGVCSAGFVGGLKGLFVEMFTFSGDKLSSVRHGNNKYVGGELKNGHVSGAPYNFQFEWNSGMFPFYLFTFIFFWLSLLVFPPDG